VCLSPLHHLRLFKKILFYGGVINNWIAEQISKIPLFNQANSDVALAIIYLIIIYILIQLQENVLKPVIKFAIFALIGYLILGFFG